MDQFAALSEGIAARLEKLDPPNEHDAETRREILLLNALRCGYAPEEIAAIANPQSRRKAA